MERIVIEIVGDTTKIQSTIDQLQKLGQVDNQNAKTFQANNKKTNQALNQTSKDVGFLNNQIQNLGNTIAGAFAVGALVQFGKQAVDTAAKIDSITKSLEFITGGSKQAAATMEYLKTLSNKLGLEFVSTAQAFKLFAGATTQSGMSLSQTKTIFESVAKATTTMGLTAEDANGVFLALSQVMSKGTVQAEELRGQIGERIPGAFSIAARAIGVTEQQLNKMLEQGQVLSKDFLPKFAKQLETDLGGGAERAANSTQAALNRISNTWSNFKNWFGSTIVAPIVQGAADIIKAMNNASPQTKAATMAQADLNAEYAKFEKQIASIEFEEMKYLKAQELIAKAQNSQKGAIKAQKIAYSELGDEINKYYYEFQRQNILKLRAEKGEEAFLTQLSISGNKRIKNLVQEIRLQGEYVNSYDDLIPKMESYQQGLIQENAATDDNIKKKDKKSKATKKELNEYEELIKSARDTEEALQVLYASGAVENTPLEIKLRGLLAQIEMINDRIEMAKNGMQEMQTTSGSEKGGTGKAYTNAITAFGSVEENKIATDDIVKNAEKANEEFARIEEERTNKFREEQAKRRQLEMAAIQASIQIISMGVDFAYQSKQAEYDYEMSLLDAAYNNKKISEEDYQKRRSEILNQQANAEKEAALFRATIQTASAVISAFADGGPVLAALAAFVGAAQIALIAATPVPKYFEGTESLKLNGAPRGKDTILMYGNEGEAIIPTDENKKYPGLAKAWIDGKLDDYVMSNFMLPMINPRSYEVEQQKSFAENVANSIVLNQDFGTIESKLKRLDETEKAVGNKIVSAIKQQKEKIW